MPGRKPIVCICGSMTFIEEMETLGSSLSELGYQVTTPSRDERDSHWDSLSERDQVSLKRELVEDYLAHIKGCDVVLLANFAKGEVEGYVGANTLMEASFAKALDIPIAVLFDPGPQACQLEIRSIINGCLDGDPLRLRACLQRGN